MTKQKRLEELLRRAIPLIRGYEGAQAFRDEVEAALQLPDEPKAPQCGATVGETSGFSAAECALPAGHPGAHQWQPLNRGGDRG